MSTMKKNISDISSLEKDLYNIACPLKSFTSETVVQYCTRLATAECTNEVFVYHMLLGLSAGVLPSTTGLQYMGKKLPLPMFLLAIGRPGCGKTTCVQNIILEPLSHLEKETSTKIRYDTGSKKGLLKFVEESKENNILISSDEMWNFFGNTLHRQCREKSGDVQILTAAWSGQSIRCTLKTSHGVDLKKANISISGSIQTSHALTLLESTDCGDGFIDRFLMITPPTPLPMPEEQEAAVNARESDNGYKSPTVIAHRIYDLHRNANPISTYTLSAEAKNELNKIVREHREKFNLALETGEPYTDNKSTEHVWRVAVHAHIIQSLIESDSICTELSADTIKRAALYVTYCRTVQKKLSRDINVRPLSSQQNNRLVPDTPSLANDLLSFRGTVLYTCVLKTNGNRRLKSTPTKEILDMFSDLEALGAGDVFNERFFRKCHPETIPDDALDFCRITRSLYTVYYSRPNHAEVEKILSAHSHLNGNFTFAQDEHSITIPTTSASKNSDLDPLLPTKTSQVSNEHNITDKDSDESSVYEYVIGEKRSQSPVNENTKRSKLDHHQSPDGF